MEFRLQNMRGLFLTVFLFQIRTLYLFEIVKVVIQSTTALNIVEYGSLRLLSPRSVVKWFNWTNCLVSCCTDVLKIFFFYF